VIDLEGREIARGISAYNAVEARAILGCASDRIEQCLGYRGPDELIHRDDLAIIER
jgi:glutamate 5-kinase